MPFFMSSKLLIAFFQENKMKKYQSPRRIVRHESREIYLVEHQAETPSLSQKKSPFRQFVTKILKKIKK
jgi:hypothetical protein